MFSINGQRKVKQEGSIFTVILKSSVVFDAAKFSPSFMGKFSATGAYYIQRIKIHNLSIKTRLKIRAMSRGISKYVHMCNNRVSTRFLAASETTELLRITITGAAPAGKRILAQSQTTVYGRRTPPSHSLAVQKRGS